jgi:hypothetical protein
MGSLRNTASRTVYIERDSRSHGEISNSSHRSEAATGPRGIVPQASVSRAGRTGWLVNNGSTAHGTRTVARLM